MKNFKIEKCEFGKRMVVCGEFTQAMVDYCIRKKITSMELSRAKGFEGEDLNFLSSLSFLQSFEFIDWTINDLSPIHYLTNLRHLSIDTYCKTPLDFSVFKNLEDLSFYWHKNIKTLSSCSKLKKLFIYKYNPKSKDLSELSGLGQLQSLRLKMPSFFSLNGISSLDSLTEFGIYGATKLLSIKGVGGLNGLKHFDLDCCKKVEDLSEIAKLKNLEVLSISNAGRVDTISHIACLNNLSMFNFVESTNVADGNLLFLKALPKLRDVSYQNRAHYNVKREELWKLTDEKSNTI